MPYYRHKSTGSVEYLEYKPLSDWYEVAVLDIEGCSDSNDKLIQRKPALNLKSRIDRIEKLLEEYGII